MRSVLLGLCWVVVPSVALAQPAGPPAAPAPEAVSPAAGTGAPAVGARDLLLVGDRYLGAKTPPPSGWRLMISDLSVFRLNPLGLETRARIGVQKKLYPSTAAITQHNFAFVGAFPKLNPAAAILAVGGELQPASIFNLRASAEVQQYFGTVGFLQSFGSANANYSDQTLSDLRDDPAMKPQTARILNARIQPLVQLKLGPIAFKGQAQLDYWVLSNVRDGETTAYEATYDTLLPDRGWTLSTDVDLLYVGRPGLAIGLRHSHVHPFYEERHFVDAADFAAYAGHNMHSRLGLFAAYTFKDLGPSTFNKPTVLLIASWYHQHRYRMGTPDTLPTGGRPDDYTSRAFPYLLAGFTFESDLWSVR